MSLSVIRFQFLAHRQDVLTVGAFVADTVHIVAHHVDAQSADRAFLGRQCRVDLATGRGVEGLSAVNNVKRQPLFVSADINVDVAACSRGLGIVHNIDDSFFDGEIDLHRR